MEIILLFPLGFCIPGRLDGSFFLENRGREGPFVFESLGIPGRPFLVVLVHTADVADLFLRLFLVDASGRLC